MSSRLWRVLGVVVLLGGVGVGAGALWMGHTADARLARTYAAHAAEVPVPFPLDAAEIDALRAARAAATPAPAEGAPAEGAPAEGAPVADPLAGVDLGAIALERAISRGDHLVHARYACVECHGKDFGGGTMIDDPKIGRLLGPNLTSGEGSVTREYTSADWDRIVRHGLRRDGTPAVMPSGDFLAMTDRELSDIIAYIQSQPPVDRPSSPPNFGPLGTVLVATGQFPLSAEMISDHQAAHAVEPPAAEATAAFGGHLVRVCTGCHGEDLRGGPIPGAPPDWLPAANLTPHEQGLKGWSLDDFKQAMREGKRPDGAAVRPPMTQMMPYARAMTDLEMEALWAYLSALPGQPTPG